jgi:hypothetical protein
MNCTACGTPNEVAAKFCASCGKPLVAPAAPAPAAPKAFAATAVMGAVRPDLPPPQPQQAFTPPQQPGFGAPPQQPAYVPPAAAPQPYGAAPQFGQQQAPTGPAICAACGACFVSGKCLRCGGVQPAPSPVPTQGVHWAQVRLSIKCMTCQRASPLTRLDMDGRFFCYGCSRDLFFDVDLWKEDILFSGSAFGDALWANAGTFPPWPKNEPTGDAMDDLAEHVGVDAGAILNVVLEKCREMGRSEGGMSIEHGGMSMGSAGTRTRGLAVTISPGHPLCAQCKAPLDTSYPADGVVVAACPRCHTSETYRAPPAAKAMCNELCGVLAPEHVEGRETARIAAQPGSAALAVTCPKCGSGLQLAPGARITNCPYCKVTSVVPDHIAAAGAPPPAVPDPLWLAFRAPSAVRTGLIEAAQTATARASEAANEATQKPPDDSRARKLEEAQRLAKAQQSRNVMVALGIVPAVLVFGGIFAFQSGALDGVLHREKDKDKKEGQHATDTTPAATKTTKPAKPAPVTITSCTCAFGDGQSTPQVTLTVQAPPSDGGAGWLLDIEKTSGFISEGRTSKFPVQAGAVLPPLMGAAAPPHMGIACDTGIFVLVADKIATGWSSVNVAWKWNTTLPAASIDAADAGATTAPLGTDYAGGCTPLVVKNGAAALSLSNGKHVSLSLKDGKVH